MFRLLATLIFTLPLLHSVYALDDLSVGIATSDITPAVEDRVPVGGFGSVKRRDFLLCLWVPDNCLKSFKPASGTLDPIRAKAMYLARADRKLLFIGLDMIGVTAELYMAINKRLVILGFNPSEVIISATHTHSGPGALSSNKFWEIAAMGKFRSDYHERVLSKIAETVKVAMNTAAPSDLYTMKFDTHDLQSNRRGANRPLNPTANFLLAQRKTGEWIGGLVNFAVHGTSLDAGNLFFSSDVPGAIEMELEKFVTEQNGLVRLDAKAEFIFINGAEGDVTPKLEYREMGSEFVNQMAAHWDNKEPLNSDWTVKQKEVYLGKPRMNLRVCTGKNFPRTWAVSLAKHISRTTLISQVQFGNLWFLTWPGEPTTELGLKLANAAKEMGAEDAWIFGLSNGYLAYFVSSEEFNHGGYEACSSYYGGIGAERIIQGHKTLAQE